MPQSAVLPGQQPTPNASKAMPVTRAAGLATPVNSAPNSSRPTSDGTISSARPVANSRTAARLSIFFTALVIRLVFRASDAVGDFRHVLLFLLRVLRRAEVECQLVDL